MRCASSYFESNVAGKTNLSPVELTIVSAPRIRLLDPAADHEAWRDAAHSLKGSALGIGAFALAEQCAAAEKSEEADLGVRTVLLDHVRTALDAALADIAAYCHEQALKSLKG